MKRIILSLMLSAAAMLPSKAQFAVIDPANIATSIINSVNEIVQTSSTVSNVAKNFQEVQKVYKMGKEYYDRLKAVHDLVKDAKKVRDAILIVGEIGDIYVNSYERMLSDKHFTYEELAAVSNGYAALLGQSADMLMEMKDAVNVNGLSMTDHERMSIINDVYDRLVKHRALVNYYTRKTISVSYLRAKKAGDAERVAALYGTSDDRHW